MKAGIIDYGLGNVRSVAGAVRRLGWEAVLSSNEEELAAMDKLILPGVGAFGDGMKNLQQRGLIEPLHALVTTEQKPILGICLGAQLMAEESFEFGHHRGLGWLPAAVRPLSLPDPRLRVPHVGWNNLHQTAKDPLFTDVPDDALFYYVHSFYIDSASPELVVGECDYGQRFAAVLHRGNIFATQFHPEKSQRHGMQVLKNFLELSSDA